MFVEPGRSPYDLSFRLFRFPVRVSPWFWIMSLLLGASTLDRGLIYLLIWIAVVFVSILVHELGHALAHRWFGAGSHIVLYSFGGLTVPWTSVGGRWRRIVISLAGPGAGFAFFGLIYLSDQGLGWSRFSGPTFMLYWQLVFLNLFWGFINLLPIWPLDGGQVSMELCRIIWRRNGQRIALEISIAVAGLVALYSLACEIEAKQGTGWFVDMPWWARGSLWTAILFGMLAVVSYQTLQQSRWSDSHWDDGDVPPWKR